MSGIAEQLLRILPSQKVKAKLIDRHAFAGDAGFYFLLPEVVVQPDSVEEIKKLFQFASKQKIPLTFRAGGTSLSGQSISDGILVDLSRNWKKVQAGLHGETVQVQPAVIGAHVNLALKKFGKKMGPDPASITAAMMGGILSNNSSGMCCGVVHNSYHTIASIHFVLPNGNEFDTSKPTDYDRFNQEESKISEGLLALRNGLLANSDLVEKIKSKYTIKNTVGYSLNAFLDYDQPLDILAHLLIGAEGTLAFIASAVLNTIPDKPNKITGMLYFENPVVASENIPILKSTGAEALELMDRPALRSIGHLDYCPEIVKSLPENATAILCEFQAESREALIQLFEAAQPKIRNLPVLHIPEFTEDAQQQAYLWKLRKGMYPSVAAVRARGTTAMLEDVAVPLARMGEAVKDLQDLFKKYGYHDAIIFGHAKEGNLHFLITQPVNQKSEIDVFEAFNDELAALIIQKYDGSLKAEHGTGRQIAPFVKDEWGPEAYAIMQTLKKLVDPLNILNPGVILNADDRCHLKNLKTMPVVEEEVDKCVECGYCENRCPSRDYTMTPRQRIQVRRSLQRLKANGQTEDYNTVLAEYQFAGMDTCAVDGMCATDCPVSINTGELIKRLRRENHSDQAKKLALMVAKNFGLMEGLVKTGVYAGNAINSLSGGKGMISITNLVKSVVPGFPLWMSALKEPVSIKANEITNADVVYFPTCVTRMMGADGESKENITEVLKRLCDKAGIKLFVSGSTTGVCCGQLFSSKGFEDSYAYTVNQTIELLWNQTKEGELPVIVDITSCTHSLQNAKPYLTETNKNRFDKIRFLDSIDFTSDWLLPKVEVIEKKKSVVFHPVCTAYKMGLIPKLQSIGNACAEIADVPALSGCCGMAGDRGFYYPELTACATKNEVAEVVQKEYDGYYSSSKTCEMALAEASTKNYQSVFYLLDEVT
jgi:D-lactate dehydrogenase